MYFKNFPNIYYRFKIGEKDVLKAIRDITQNVRVRKELLENITVYDEYDIMDGDTPEIISHKIYGSAEYHWVIMLANQRFDYVHDFPKSTRTLEEYIHNKYEQPYGVHHYEKDGFVVDSTVPGCSSISNYQYESDLNETKRRIKIISPRLLSAVINEFKQLI